MTRHLWAAGPVCWGPRQDGQLGTSKALKTRQATAGSGTVNTCGPLSSKEAMDSLWGSPGRRAEKQEGRDAKAGGSASSRNRGRVTEDNFRAKTGCLELAAHKGTCKQVKGELGKTPLGCLSPFWRVWFQCLLLHFQSNFLLMHTWKAAGDSCSCTPTGQPHTEFWLQRIK